MRKKTKKQRMGQYEGERKKQRRKGGERGGEELWKEKLNEIDECNPLSLCAKLPDNLDSRPSSTVQCYWAQLSQAR